MNLARRVDTRNKCRTFCFMMIFMIVLTGMCCRMGQTDSLFCAVTGQTQTILSGEVLTNTSEACTQELIKREQVIPGVYSRMVRVRTNIKMLLFFIIAGLLLRFLKHILITVAQICEQRVHSNTVIVNYIHQQDGKKR